MREAWRILLSNTMKASKKTLSIVLSAVFALALFASFNVLRADTNSNTSGYLWSSNIGWVKMNDCEDPDNGATCSGGSYGVNIPATNGPITGYAWSSNIGWITFNSAGCPLSGCTPGARITWNGDGTGTISGWARACSVFASGCSGEVKGSAYLGTWDGFIALDAASAGTSGWGLTVGQDDSIGGYAWGSNVIGWIKSINATIGSAFTVQLAANPTAINRGDSSTLTITASNIDGPNACSIAGIGGVTMTKSGLGWSGSVSVSPSVTTNYTATCSKSGQSQTASATVTVAYFAVPTTDGGSGGYCAITGNYPQLTWDSDATSCTISSVHGSVSVAPSAQAAGGSLGTDGLYYASVNIPMGENNTNYQLQCSGGTVAVNKTVTVNACATDFAISVSPASQLLAPTGPEDSMMSATYTVSVIPQSGFRSAVALSLQSLPAGVPKSASVSFSPATLSYSGGYATSQMTISFKASDIKTSKTFSPVVIKGVGNGLTRTAQFSVGADVKLKPVYIDD